jgi:hypothetical protein
MVSQQASCITESLTIISTWSSPGSIAHLRLVIRASLPVVRCLYPGTLGPLYLWVTMYLFRRRQDTKILTLWQANLSQVFLDPVRGIWLRAGVDVYISYTTIVTNVEGKVVIERAAKRHVSRAALEAEPYGLVIPVLGTRSDFVARCTSTCIVALYLA